MLNYFLDCILNISTAEYIVNTPAGIFISHPYFFGIPWEIRESCLLLKYILFNVFHACPWCVTSKKWSWKCSQAKEEIKQGNWKKRKTYWEGWVCLLGLQVFIWERARQRRGNRLKPARMYWHPPHPPRTGKWCLDSSVRGHWCICATCIPCWCSPGGSLLFSRFGEHTVPEAGPAGLFVLVPYKAMC